ncbi:MAG: hypothetical protein Q8K62_03380 [Thiobacillus sp.]|nr:hypothetical protein [Thiobacillus sp.]
MLRTSLIAAALLLTPVAAVASGDRYDYGEGYGDRHGTSSRIVVAPPRIAISIGSGPRSGFNGHYQEGYRPAVAAPYYYAPVVVREPYYRDYRDHRGHRAHHRHAHRDWHGDRRDYRDRDRRHDNHRGWDD